MILCVLLYVLLSAACGMINNDDDNDNVTFSCISVGNFQMHCRKIEMVEIPLRMEWQQKKN